MKIATLRASVTAAATAAKRRVSVTLSRGKKAMATMPTRGTTMVRKRAMLLKSSITGLAESPPEEPEEYNAYCHHQGVVVHPTGDMQA